MPEQQQQQQQPPAQGTVESLVSKLDQLLGRQPQGSGGDPDDGDDDGAPPQKVPYAKLQKAIERRRAAEQGLTDVKKLVEGLQQRHETEKAEIKKQLADYAAQAELRRQEDVGFAKLGLDDDSIEVIRAAWKRQPEDKRGKTATAWWGEQIKLHEEHTADEKKPAPQLHPSVAVLLPKVQKQQEQSKGGRTDTRLPPRGESRSGQDGPPQGVGYRQTREWYEKNRSRR
jgi:hypothetical protein